MVTELDRERAIELIRDCMPQLRGTTWDWVQVQGKLAEKLAEYRNQDWEEEGK